MKKKSVVTGGAGFLGSHICDQLINQGHEVICIDNKMSGRVSNISHLMTNDAFEFIEHDVIEPLPVACADEVWNLACPASPLRYQLDPIHTMMTNVLGTKNALDLALATKARLFQASTSEIYGDPEVHPQPEGYRGAVNTTGPRACYDEGKRAAETLCFDYHRHFCADIRVVRIFNTYGPRMDPEDGRVVSNFIVNALKNQPLELYGGGSQTRSFCYVDDLIDGFLRFMQSDTAGTGPINIGNPGEFTIRELAEIVSDIHGNGNEFINVPAPEDDPHQRKPDIERANRLLGWEPKVPIREGLKKTYAYFQREISRGVAGDVRKEEAVQ